MYLLHLLEFHFPALNLSDFRQCNILKADFPDFVILFHVLLKEDNKIIFWLWPATVRLRVFFAIIWEMNIGESSYKLWASPPLVSPLRSLKSPSFTFVWFSLWNACKCRKLAAFEIEIINNYKRDFPYLWKKDIFLSGKVFVSWWNFYYMPNETGGFSDSNCRCLNLFNRWRLKCFFWS